MTNRNIFEDYFLGRYELYVSVNDIDEYGKDFCLFEYSDGFLNNIEKSQRILGCNLISYVREESCEENRLF